jgi:hypothetical protein
MELKLKPSQSQDLTANDYPKRKGSLPHQESLFSKKTNYQEANKLLQFANSQDNLLTFETGQRRKLSETSLIEENSKKKAVTTTGYKFITKEEATSSIRNYGMESNRSRGKGKVNTMVDSLQTATKVLSTRKRFLTILNRGHSNIFDAIDSRQQDVYCPNELIDSEQVSMNSSSMLRRSSIHENSLSKRKARLNTQLSSHISIVSSYESFSEITANRSSHHVSNPYTRKRSAVKLDRPRGVFLGNFNM